MSNGRTQYPGQRISFRSDDLILRGMARARELKRSFSQYICFLLEDDLEKHPPSPTSVDAVRADRMKRQRKGREKASSSSAESAFLHAASDNAGKQADAHLAVGAPGAPKSRQRSDVSAKSKSRPGGPGRAPLLLLFIYFIPTVVVLQNSRPNAGAIIVLNLVAGWTFVGWVVALVWSLTVPKR